jgi:hypothetical protein
VTREERNLALARQIVAGTWGAACLARIKERPYAFDMLPETMILSVRESYLPSIPGFERIAVLNPDVTEEDTVGLCKSLYTARCQGEHIPESILRAVSPLPPKGGTPEHKKVLAAEAEAKARKAAQAGKPGQGTFFGN